MAKCDHCGNDYDKVEANGSFYCCDHCAEKAGVTAPRDRV